MTTFFAHIKSRFFALAFVVFSVPQLAFAQSDSSFGLSSSTSAPLPEHALSFLDSSETIWSELLESLFQDTLSLPDTARAWFYALTQSLDRDFKSHLLDRRSRLATSSEHSAFTTRQSREQAHLADLMLTLYDSLARAFEALLPRKNLVRAATSEDYKDILNTLFLNRTSAHRVQFSTAYQSRSVWRGIEQNSGNGAYSLSALYQHRSGIFLSASALGLQGQSPVIDQASASIGLDYRLFDNFLFSFAYARYYYSESSVQVRAFIHSDLALWLSFQTSWLTPSVMFLWAFSDEGNKFFCSWEISHVFLLSPFSSGKLALVPSVSGEYGTISTVSVERRTRTRFNPNPQLLIRQAEPFVLTNYLFSLSLLYSIGNFSIAPEWIFVVPINLPTLTFGSTSAGNLVQPITRTIRLGDKPFGYFSVLISYSL